MLARISDFLILAAMPIIATIAIAALILSHINRTN